jgi:hypothetical protein
MLDDDLMTSHLSRRNTCRKQMVDLSESATFELGHVEKGPYGANKPKAAEHETDLGETR